jgi:hypothetical protein
MDFIQICHGGQVATEPEILGADSIRLRMDFQDLLQTTNLGPGLAGFSETASTSTQTRYLFGRMPILTREISTIFSNQEIS